MDKKIIITGAAGLVGQNLIIELKKAGFTRIFAVDKHPQNVTILKSLHPDLMILETDLISVENWQHALLQCDVLITLHAQIGAKDQKSFVDNNVEATQVVITQAKLAKVPYIIHVSSSVVESVADDNYTKTKKQQESIVISSGINYCILRPTLMFGWFDRKHLGWLSRFMQRIAIFPIPGNGKYMRQPLYAGDFCKIIMACVLQQPVNKIFNITGREKIYYIDLIRMIRRACKAKTIIILIPYGLFWVLLKIYGFFSSNPPFTADQLKALTARDEFELIEWWNIFSVSSTPLESAINVTFNDPIYSKITLDF
ncbi:MAG: NAD-dependent epimerase/dehydratase family protein [Gammaproteobacteria bacterium]|nr:NAD-dependent epimerase/dehydratase family protein [Gammaproteobacteria bacterium]